MFVYSAYGFRLHIKIEIVTNNIHVSISKEYILQSRQWEKCEITRMSQIASQGRIKKITKHQIKQPNAGTISILLRKSLIFNSIYDFTLENK